MRKKVEKVVDKVLELNLDEEEGHQGGGGGGGKRWKSKYIDFIYTLRSQYFPTDLDDPIQLEYFKKMEESLKAYKYLAGGCKLLDVLLQTRSTCKIKVRIDLSNFGLVGFQIVTSNGQPYWYEFGLHHTWRRALPTHRIPGSSLLNVRGFFTCMEREIGQTLHNLCLGQQTLTNAINFLAVSLPIPNEIDNIRRLRIWSLFVVKVMICEAVRFPAVSQHFASTYHFCRPLPPLLVNMIHNFAGTSVTFVAEREENIHCCNRLLANGTRVPRHRLFAKNQQVERQMPPKQPGKSEKLVEVFSACINSIDGESPSDCFYGTISFTNQSLTRLIYRRKRKEVGFIHSGDQLLPICLSSCIPIVFNYIGFNFVICGKKIPLYEDQIDWDHLWKKYDTPLCDEFVNDKYSVMLRFIVLKNAVQATVEVIVLADAHICGEISAISGLPSEDSAVVLFQKTSKEHVEVFRDKHLKLLRSTVAVPRGSSIRIEADLSAVNAGKFSPFACGIAIFPANVSGQQERTIPGAIRAKVTWT